MTEENNPQLNRIEAKGQEHSQLDRIENSTRRPKAFKMSNGYTTRELDVIFQSIKDQLSRFELSTGQTLEEIKVQTQRTNGSVLSLKLWRSYITGGLVILSVIVLPILAYLAVLELDTSTAIQAHLQSSKTSSVVNAINP